MAHTRQRSRLLVRLLNLLLILLLLHLPLLLNPPLTGLSSATPSSSSSPSPSPSPLLALTASGLTVGQNNQESRRKHWATRSSVCSFARTACSFACSALLALLARSAALTRSLAPLTRGTVIDYHILRNKRPPASPSFLRRIKKSFGF